MGQRLGFFEGKGPRQLCIILYLLGAILFSGGDFIQPNRRPDFIENPLNPHLLTKILEGDDMTPKEKNFYYASRKALDTNA